MLHFEPGSPYLNTLRQADMTPSLAPRIMRFDQEAERNHLRQWPHNTAEAIRHFIEHPETIGTHPILVGHSAGGFTVFVLGAMAKGADLVAIRDSLPGLRAIPLGRFEQLSRNLEQGLFISIASPFTGVKLTRTGRLLNRFVIQPRDTYFIRALTIPFVQTFYQKIGKRPEQVIDGNIVSDVAPPSMAQGPANFAVNLLIRGGLKVFSPFLDHGKHHDGIVPIETARLEGVPELTLKMDHLDLVESEDAAQSLLSLITMLNSSVE